MENLRLIKKRIAIIMVAGVFFGLCFACSTRLPDINEMNAFLTENQRSVSIIFDFVQHTGSDELWITKRNKEEKNSLPWSNSYYYELYLLDTRERTLIIDPDILNALNSLGTEEVIYDTSVPEFRVEHWKSISMSGGLIYLPDLESVDFNDDYTPHYFTEVHELSAPRWYYYIYNYNEWRQQPDSYPVLYSYGNQ